MSAPHGMGPPKQAKRKKTKVLTITDLPRILPRLSRSKAIGILPDGTLELLPSWTAAGQLEAFNAGVEARSVLAQATRQGRPQDRPFA